MMYAVFFQDNEELSAMRPKFMTQHLDFLKQNEHAIHAAGPLFEEDSGAGGLWVVEADDQKAVSALVEADPFWPTGLRKSVKILRWHQVFADGKALQ